MLLEIQYLISSYLTLSELLKIHNHQTLDQIIKRYPRELPSLDEASQNIEILKYLVYRGSKPSEKNLYTAILRKDFEIIHYLHQLDVDVDAHNDEIFDLIYQLSKKEYLDILIYIKTKGIKIDYDNIFNHAIIHVNLDTIKYLYSVNYKGDEYLFDFISDVYNEYQHCRPQKQKEFDAIFRFLVDKDIINIKTLINKLEINDVADLGIDVADNKLLCYLKNYKY